jgi:glucosyl-dolichyl phosphate glucuronosyltransferase
LHSDSLISVIIPTCFREELLIDCVASILSQAYPCFEVIVIDQAPEPLLRATLEARFGGDRRIRYIHAVSAGAARARNIGIQQAAGKIVAFIDDDAVAERGWLAGVSLAFACQDPPALMAGRILPLWEGERPAWYPREREFLLGLYDIGDTPKPLPAGDLPIGANMAGLREAILDHGGFEESLGPNYFRKHKLVTGEETILGQRIRASGLAVIYEPRATVTHRISRRKLDRYYFLRRNFWEGFVVIRQMKLLGKIGKTRWPHYRYHGVGACMALARFVLPGYGSVYSDAYPVVRMAALSRLSYSLGVIWGLSARGEEEN